jgi:hypothetical protein
VNPPAYQVIALWLFAAGAVGMLWVTLVVQIRRGEILFSRSGGPGTRRADNPIWYWVCILAYAALAAIVSGFLIYKAVSNPTLARGA